MYEPEKQLHQLIAAVWQHPDDSLERKRAMNRLLILVLKLPEFKKYSRLDCPEYLQDAMNQTLEWLSRNIRNFKPRTSSTQEDLVRWIKSHLYWRTKDLTLTDSQRCHYLDNYIIQNDEIESTTWLEQLSDQGQLLGTASNPSIPSGIEIYIEQSERQLEQQIVQALALYIEKDSSWRLRNCYPRNYPKCNCQVLSQRLLFIFKKPPDRYSDLAQEFNINYQTLVWHWKRKALPLLQAITIELGYKPHS